MRKLLLTAFIACIYALAASVALAQDPKAIKNPTTATPAEIAVKAVQDYDIASLSFADMEFILRLRDASPAKKNAADRGWHAIQARRIKIPIKVIAATTTEIEAALTDDYIRLNKADFHIVLTRPLDKPPAPGALINVIGTLSDYTIAPFQFIIINGEI